MLTGCYQHIRDHADRHVYDLVERRQDESLADATRAEIRHPDRETGDGSEYDFTPSPLLSEIPPEFAALDVTTDDSDTPTAPPPTDSDDQSASESTTNGGEPGVDPPTTSPNESENGGPAPEVTSPSAAETSDPNPPTTDGDAPETDAATSQVETSDGEASESPAAPDGADVRLSKDIFTAEERLSLEVFGLADAIAYGLVNARDLQNAKEDLYLAGLDLSVERWLWTPRFSATVRAEYANYGQVRDFDHAMSAVAQAAVTQRLPLGGEITARVIGSFMRDLGESVTSGETGTAILEANIPLLRGAGRVAYESRYLAERELIYAVRSYERFRRTFVVSIANDFFNLQVLKASIDNTYGSYLSRYRSWEKTDFINRMGRSENISDATRALSNLRSAEVALVARKEQFASALDRFKIRLGMSVDTPLDVLPFVDDPIGQQVESLIPQVDDRVSIDIALKYRLDLITSADSVDDARRGVAIAKNQILPDLDLSGSITMATDANEKAILGYNTERTTWRAAIDLQMDDRVPERAAYRRSLVTVRRAERLLDQDQDTVRADVRRALRQIVRNRDVRDIQALNVQENELRRDASLAQYNLGKASNQDVIDAENELLQAQDSLANAIADYRTAILQFRLDTGTLLVSDEGTWDAHGDFDPPSTDTAQPGS
ncbi:MAG: TolC family protein [Phycisphaerae bacterium]